MLSDDAGVLAYALRAYVPQGARPAARVVAGGPSVAVEDGWYLLTAAGRRPLFAWVKGAAVELGDKSDTPVVSKQVNAGAGWSDAALAGSGRVVSYRVDVSMPQAIEADRVYPLTVVDAWDAALTLAEDSLRVEVVASGNTAAPRDVTEFVDLQVSGQEVTLFVANVHDLGVDLGDVLRLTYTMSLDPYAQLGAAGAVNSAHAVFPSWTGQETTPRDEARVYALHIAIKKVNKAGDPLQDAVFALRTNEGWLAADGSFGAQSTRAEFTSNASGLVEGVPLLSDGSYELVELQAPKGYRKLDADGVPFELSAATADGRLAYNARATKPLRVVDVDAASVTAHLELVNEKAGGLLDSLIPQTGDSAWVLGAAAVAAAGCAVLLMGMRRTRRRG